MIGVTLLFILLIPFSPVWPLFCSKSAWGTALRISLWIRSLISLSLLLGGLRFTYLELWIGIACYRGLEISGKVMGTYRLPNPHWTVTALMSLLVGLTLLGVVAVIACVLRCFIQNQPQTATGH